MHGDWSIRCYDKNGELKWVDDFENMVVNQGLNHLLDVTFHGATQVTTWYIGLLAASPSPQAGWTATDITSNDFANYAESDLQAFVESAPSGQSITNSANKASFTINANGSSVGGCYLISTNAKSSPSGIVYCAGAFATGNKACDDGDTLQVGVTLSTADDGV